MLVLFSSHVNGRKLTHTWYQLLPASLPLMRERYLCCLGGNKLAVKSEPEINTVFRGTWIKPGENMVHTSLYLDVPREPGHSLAFKSTKFGSKWVVFLSLYDSVCAFPIIFFDWWSVFILFSIFKLECLVVNVAINTSTFSHWLAEHLHRPVPFLLNLYWHCPILRYAPGGALGVWPQSTDPVVQGNSF